MERVKTPKECKKLARGQQDEGDQNLEIEGGGTEGGKRIKTAMCRGMVTKEGERKSTKEAARRRRKGSDGGEDEKWKESGRGRKRHA